MRSVALWPLSMLVRKINRANRILIRWAMRHRSKHVYLFALFWSPTLIAGLLIWAIAAIPFAQEGAAAIVVTAAILKKTVALVTFLAALAQKLEAYWGHYRRQFYRKK